MYNSDRTPEPLQRRPLSSPAFQMPSSPWIPTAGAPPPRAAPAVLYSSPSERHSVKEAGSVVSNAQEFRARVPPLENSEVENQEHEEKVNKYQAVLAARLKAKYFSSKAFGKEDVFKEMTIQSETILLSRCPFSSLFADPAKFHREKSCSKEDICPSLTNASFAKHNHLSLVGEASSKKLVGTLSAEKNSLTPVKWHFSMNTT